MHLPDLINGIAECGGGIVIWRNIFQLMKDKQIKGVHWSPTLWFTMWGFWNIFYYPYLHQFLSLVGGIFVVIANATWLVLAIRYWDKPSRQSIEGDASVS